MARAAIVLTLLAIAAWPASAAAQAKFVGIDDDAQIGESSAPVTIIEFGDYQCPSCRAFWRDTLPRLKKEYVETGRVRIVFRDFPIRDIHPEAEAAAMAAECAGDQGRYFELHDKIFREQDRRGRDVVRFRVQDLKRWAAEIGLDPAPFADCLDSGRYADEVARDHADGVAVGISGTPVFFVNGRMLAGAHPFSTFQKVIEDALRR